MDNKILNLTYTSSLTDLCALNSSFDSGVLAIAYPGLNNNGSYISKETFERCVKTVFNCPIVCNYDRESDTLGGHDMELVEKDGALTLVNLTTPVGCVPESANIFWKEIVEDDGILHEYLCAEVLLWKRQEAYQKIKKDGVVAHSMEITVKDGESRDGVYYIYDFEFTAFALIGVQPCFESSALEMFSKMDFKQQLSEMMLELKESFNLVKPSQEDDNNQQNSTEGGEQVLDKNELITKYGIDTSVLDFSIEDVTYEELEEKFKAMVDLPSNAEPSSDDDQEETPTIADQEDTSTTFALTQCILEEMRHALSAVKVCREWGECTRYWFVDCDMDACEIYCLDSEDDWLLYGFAYEMNGDSVVINFDSKKRMQYAIVDFDDGADDEQASPISAAFAYMEGVIQDNAGWEAKYQTASNTIESMNTELELLRSFKNKTELAIAQSERDSVLAQFEDLSGIDAFENLREHCADYDAETLEEKCYAIRGKHGVSAKFSLEAKPPKFKVEHTNTKDEPYGGLFEKYGFSESK